MMLPDPPPRGPISWLRVTFLIVGLIALAAFWIAVVYGIEQVLL